ncbi:SLATT domain-containing protein [Lapillicoccus jejuensis]|uniref:SMODS and SLOG-associating 2TM effector domain-containing protein n=1 Tax=Lapillicoccus jejuensis TaxID=402171 RepID=A0A542DZL4_9MICO|nr:SLATT domain-containing protein [Lapillicoccus jejuensis]TQJ08506.1 hypothetical protein FB458_1596 [Lapillicoccus jejuensis]
MTGPASGDEEAARALVLAWYRRARTAQEAHARAAARARTTFLLLGIPPVVLGLVAGSALAADAFAGHRWVIALVSLLAASLTALQTFLRLDDRRLAHETASRRFGVVRRRLGELGALGLTDPDLRARLDEVREEYDQTSAGSPQVPPRIWAAQKAADATYVPPELV